MSRTSTAPGETANLSSSTTAAVKSVSFPGANSGSRNRTRKRCASLARPSSLLPVIALTNERTAG